MKSMKTPQRLLQMLTLLQSGRRFTAAELAVRFELTERSIRNDMERLRELGYPVIATRGRIGGYRLGSGANLPPLQLDDEEALAIAIGLQTATSSGIAGIDDAALRALTKLQSMLPTRLRRRLEAIQGFALRVPSDRASSNVPSERLAILANACRDFEVVRVRYRNHAGDESRRFLEPHRLISWGQRWYLLAWDEGRDDWRTFRVDRFDQVEGVGRRYRERAMPADDVVAYITRNISRAGSAFRAVIEVDATADVVAETISPMYAVIEPIGDDRCRLDVNTDDLRATLLYVGLLGFPFTIIEPPGLIAELASLEATVRDSLSRSYAVKAPPGANATST